MKPRITTRPLLFFVCLLAALSLSASATVSVSVSPASVSIKPGAQQQFTAQVTGSSDTVVVWNLSGTGCLGNTCGQITSGGLYTAPPTPPIPNVVKVTATALADTSKTGSGAISIITPVAVSVSPATAQLLPGAQQQFSATVTGSTDTAVTWSVAGAGCSGSGCGTITTAGLYSAPAAVPNPATIAVTATSQADPSKSASATATIVAPIVVSISPTSTSVAAGAQQQFSATVTGTTNTNVSWSLTGAGSITSSGLYTAPGNVPNPPNATVTATSMADPTKFASAAITIVAPVVVSVSPASARVVTSAQQKFTATVTGTTNTAVTWSLSGGGCTGAACGIVTATGLYTAPAVVPNPATVTLTATSQADATKSDAATITIVPPVVISVSPVSATVLTGTQQQFTATVTGVGNTSVTWSLSGAGCTGSACGSVTSAGLYSAPSAVPSPATVTVTATSQADPTKSATATVTVVAPIAVSISPTVAKVSVGAQQQFTASVSNTANTNVMWSVSGAGCSGAACGSITSAGLYTAPPAVPTSPTITVTARSQADPTKSATATVTVVAGVGVSVSPTQATLLTGAQQQFTATVTGTGNTAVQWTLSSAGCSGTGCGTITSAGLYTAPSVAPNPSTVTVTATSKADLTKSATASVTVVAPVVVVVSPTSTKLVVSAQQQFTAVVTGSSNTAVTWSLSGGGCSGAFCGTITGAGLYTAPAAVPSPATVMVTATSQADSTKSASATVTVAVGVVISVSPTTATVVAGATQQFTATVTGSNNTGVTWALSGSGCHRGSCGAIDSQGLYTAPRNAPKSGTVTLTATSQADATKLATAIITVVPPVAVSVSPETAKVETGGQQQFAAAVTGSTNTGVIWSISGAGCLGPACGTITSAGLYVAPASVPTPPSVTVKATSEADATKAATAVVTVTPAVTVDVLPANAIVSVGDQLQLTARVNGSTNTAVTWKVSSPNCSGNACGSVSSKGLYTAPATVPASATVQVEAISVANVKRAGSASITLTGNNNSKLNGSYAFLFQGFDAAGSYQAAGWFSADGNGNIVNGLEDVNRVSGPALATTFTGTYTVDASNRGTLTISSSLGNSTYAFVLNSAASRARFVEFDTTGVRGAGEFEARTSTNFSNSSLSNSFAFSLSGIDSSAARVAALASIFSTGLGSITGVTMDTNDAGAVLPTFINFPGTYSITSNGHGSAIFSVPGFAGGIFHFSFYMVSPQKLYLISTDTLSVNNPMFSGEARQQLGTPYSGVAFQGPSVFSLAGVNSGSADVQIGQMAFDGDNAVTALLDENNGGSIATGISLTGGYSAQLDGRTLLNLTNSQTHAPSTLVAYLISPTTAYLMDLETTVKIGSLEPQFVQPQFNNTDLSGAFFFAPDRTPTTATTALPVGVVNFDGAGKASGIEDLSQTSGLSTDLVVTGTYSVSTTSNNGRGVLTLTSPSPSTTAFWLSSFSAAVGVDLDPGNTNPAVLRFEQ